MGPQSNNWWPSKKRKGHADTHRVEGQGKMGAEIGVMQLQAREHQACLAPPEIARDEERFFPRVFREGMALPIPCFWAFSLQNC